jgi:hypothetical protein
MEIQATNMLVALETNILVARETNVGVCDQMEIQVTNMFVARATKVGFLKIFFFYAIQHRILT